MSLEIISEFAVDLNKILKPKYDVLFFGDTEKYSSGDARLKIFLQNEPEAVRHSEKHLLEHGDKYDVILTIHESVLKKWPDRARLFQFYRCTWIDESDYLAIKPEEKRFQISCLTGFKQITKGHLFRLKLYYNQEFFPSHVHFYRSGARFIIPDIRNNPILGEALREKIRLFKDYQYSIVIENSRQSNYFTEKLIDCLITKTIPIYFGCTNIQDFFDTRGWILLTDNESPQEILGKLNTLNEYTYNMHRHIIEENYKRALNYKEEYGPLNAVLASIPGYITPRA